MKFIDRKKKPTIANVAIARELAGRCWSLAVLESEDPRTAPSSQRGLVAARGATRETPMSNGHPPVTLDARHAVPLLPKAPSCGNQPANISLTARRQRHAHRHQHDEAKGRPPRAIGTGAPPCHLTTSHSISGVLVTRRGADPSVFCSACGASQPLTDVKQPRQDRPARAGTAGFSMAHLKRPNPDRTGAPLAPD